jgi:hypothetical protein
MTDRSEGQAGDDVSPFCPAARGGEGTEGNASRSWTPIPRESPRGERPQGMIPARSRRRTKLERGSMRVLPTGGIIGLAAALGGVLVGQSVAGWIVGLAVGLTSVILATLLWSSRQLSQASRRILVDLVIRLESPRAFSPYDASES